MCDSPAAIETGPPNATAAVAVVAQSAELAHEVEWVVASNAGPGGGDAICWSQLAGVARWTSPHSTGSPTGNIWALSSSVATNLTSDNPMRDPKIAPSHRPASSPVAGWWTESLWRDIRRHAFHGLVASREIDLLPPAIQPPEWRVSQGMANFGA
jgi:hypothetical protein